MKIRAFILPAVLTVFVMGALLLIDWRAGDATVEVDQLKDENEGIIVLPFGRVLYVVVEEDGAYIGDQLVPFVVFDEFVEHQAQDWNLDYFIVRGTDLARYGRVVQAYASLRSRLKVEGTLDTFSYPGGTRFDAVAVQDHHWEY